MSVNNRKVVIIIFLAYKASGVLAECAHLVFKGLLISHKSRNVCPFRKGTYLCLLKKHC